MSERFSRRGRAGARGLQRRPAPRRRLDGDARRAAAEEFIETIPFSETRAYVMIVLANREQYRRLYGLARTRARRRPSKARARELPHVRLPPADRPEGARAQAGDARRRPRRAELRPVRLTTGFLKHAEGSCLVEFGDTRVLCAVSFEDKVPPFLKGKGEGWVTAEYGMLPRATNTRTAARGRARAAPSGRTHEIQRLIGRSLRAVVDMKALGERTVWVDCDVLQADGGTRCASITGAFVALVEGAAPRSAARAASPSCRSPTTWPRSRSAGRATRSCSTSTTRRTRRAHVDMNIVKTGRGRFVEVQGTAEGRPFSEEELAALMAAADKGIRELVGLQKQALGDFEPKAARPQPPARCPRGSRAAARTPCRGG